MKKLLLVFSLLLVFGAFTSIPAFAQNKHVTQAHRPFSACTSNPNDGNCDNQDPYLTCPDYVLIHTSGWISKAGHTMGTSLYYSYHCESAWSVTNSVGGYDYYRTGVTNTNDNHGWWTGFQITNGIHSAMGYTIGECAFAEATDGNNYQLHTTPTYCF